MTCHCFTDYLLLHSSHCFTQLQTFMAHNKDSSTGKEKELLVDDTLSEEETVDPELRTMEEKRRGTIPGSSQATTMALMCSRAQANPTVE